MTHSSVYVDWFVRLFDTVIGPRICKGHNERPPESSAPEVTRVARRVGAEASGQRKLRNATSYDTPSLT